MSFYFITTTVPTSWNYLPYSDEWNLRYLSFFVTENDTEKGADDEKEKETEKEEDVKMDDGK